MALQRVTAHEQNIVYLWFYDFTGSGDKQKKMSKKAPWLGLEGNNKKEPELYLRKDTTFNISLLAHLDFIY